MTVGVLIATATLGFIMVAYLVGLTGRHRFVLAQNMLALAFFLISISSALLAIHLTYDIPALVRMRALLSLLGIPCLYLYFASIDAARDTLTIGHLKHLVPLAAGTMIVISQAGWLLDLTLIATCLIYLCALGVLWQDRDSRFSSLGDNAPKTTLWLQVVMMFLAAILILDFLVLIDLASGGFLKQSGPLLISILSLVSLVIFALTGALGRPSLFEHLHNFTSELDFSAKQSKAHPTADHTQLAEQAMLLLKQPRILADENLTITRLARKLGVPARALSQAINSVYGHSFSVLLNDQRIELCKTIMHDNPQRSLLDVMMDAGYLTKSNFYNQFTKRVGVPPATYRANLQSAAPSASVSDTLRL